MVCTLSRPAVTLTEVPAIANGARVGVKSAALPALRDRLSIAGDLELNSGEPDVFDSYVDAAVRRFQTAQSIVADGIVGPITWGRLLA